MDWVVPIVMFLVIGAVLCTYLYLRYRARQEVLATVRCVAYLVLWRFTGGKD